jgi:hypothetical protein
MTIRRQPRARTGTGSVAPSTKGRDPRARVVPTVSEDTVRNQALQRLAEIPSTATAAEQRVAINEIVRALKGEKT